MADVAKAAGVSTATVSRVLNNPEIVPEPTRVRVEQAMAETGFVRNAIAGSLAAQRSRTVAVIIPSIRNPIFATSTQGTVDVLERHGYSVFLGLTDYSLIRETQLIRTFLERRVDGLILTGITHEVQAERMLLGSGRPCVTIWEFDKRRGKATVSFDNEDAARKMTETLISLGHKRIGFVSSPVADNDRAAGRRRGYLAALADAGISEDPTIIAEAKPFGFEDGRRAMAALLGLGTSRPSAVFFGNDVLAAGALVECSDRGLRVPDDISIAGFDDVDFARHLRPALTTVKVPTARMGALAGEMLLGMMNGKSGRKQRLDVEIVTRDSTSAPR